MLILSKQQKDSEIKVIEDIYTSKYTDWGFSDSFKISVKKFIDKLDFEDVIDSMETACFKNLNHNDCLKYFSGICWNKIKGK